MLELVGGPEEIIVPWTFEGTGARYYTNAHTCIGLYDHSTQKLRAATVFDNYSGNNVYMHVRVDDPIGLRMLVEASMKYVFTSLGCKRLTCVSESGNIRAINLHKRIGAIQEGRLVGAGRKGDDIILSRVTEDIYNAWKAKYGRRKLTNSN